MGQCTENQPKVKLFFAIMTADDALFDAAERALEAKYGPIDARDETYAFDPLTNFYAREFGVGLRKRIVAVEPLVRPESLVDVKIETNALEIELSGDQRRSINIDPGYLNHSKIILATTKDQAHRLYIDRGIFEEITLSYRRVPAQYQPNPWTYPDYRMEGRVAFFGRLRELYCQQLKTNP